MLSLSKHGEGFFSILLAIPYPPGAGCAPHTQRTAMLQAPRAQPKLWSGET